MKTISKKLQGTDIENYIKKLEKELDVVLTAKESNSVVNGFYSTHIENGEIVVKVHLYEKDEPANYTEGMYGNIPYNHGHKTEFKKLKGDISKKLEKAHML